MRLPPAKTPPPTEGIQHETSGRRSPRRASAISRHGCCTATKKVTITLDQSLVEALADAAAEEGIPVSRLIASAAERELRLRAGQAVVQEWQAEHGGFTPEELASARAEMAAADAEVLGGPEASAA